MRVFLVRFAGVIGHAEILSHANLQANDTLLRKLEDSADSLTLLVSLLAHLHSYSVDDDVQTGHSDKCDPVITDSEPQGEPRVPDELGFALVFEPFAVIEKRPAENYWKEDRCSVDTRDT